MPDSIPLILDTTDSSPQRWNGVFFESCTLASLGLRIQLGNHIPGTVCVARSTSATFTVIHTNGIHTVCMDFCHCTHPRDEHRTQLLRAGLFPATVLDPQTCATFEAMRHFHLLSLQGKLTAYDFIHGLELATDNTGLSPPPVCLNVTKNL